MRELLLAAALIAASPAGAQNMGGLMKETPSNFFTDEDTRLFREAWRRTLEQTADQGTERWSNAKSGAGGELTLQRSFEWKGNPCKEVHIRNQAQGRKADTTLNSCKVDGKWRLLSADQLKK